MTGQTIESGARWDKVMGVDACCRNFRCCHCHPHLGSTLACSRCRAREAAIRPAGPWFPIFRRTSRGLQNAATVPVDRSLRQRLHESLSSGGLVVIRGGYRGQASLLRKEIAARGNTDLGSTLACSRCRACEAAIGREADAKPGNAVYQANGGYRPCVCCADDRSLAGSAAATWISVAWRALSRASLAPTEA